MPPMGNYGAYVVTVGRQPGVYVDWPDAKWQVNELPNAIYKGYRTVAEAKAVYRAQKEKGQILAYGEPDACEAGEDADIPFFPSATRLVNRPHSTHTSRAQSARPDGARAHSPSRGRATRVEIVSVDHPDDGARRPRSASQSTGSDSSDFVLNEVDQAWLSISARLRHGEGQDAPARSRTSTASSEYRTASPHLSQRSSRSRERHGHRSSHGREQPRVEHREHRRQESGTAESARTLSRRLAVTVLEDSSGPSVEGGTNIEDGNSPLMHVRRRESRRAQQAEAAQSPNAPTRAPNGHAPQARDRETRTRPVPDASPVPIRASTSYTSPPIVTTTPAQIRHTVSVSSPGRSAASGSSRAPRRISGADAESDDEEFDYVQTRPNSPAPPVNSPFNTSSRRSVPKSNSFGLTHAPGEECKPGQPNVHTRECVPFKEYTKALAGARDPLAARFNPDKLARTRSEPAPRSSGSRSHASSSHHGESSAASRTSSSSSSSSHHSLAAPADPNRPSSLSPDMHAVTNVQSAYREGPVGLTPPTSPETQRMRAQLSRSDPFSSSVLGLSQGSVPTNAEVVSPRLDPRSPMRNGSSVLAANSFSFGRPSPSSSSSHSRISTVIARP